MPIIIDPMENATLRRWWEEGVQQGVQQGSELGQSNLLSKLLVKRFGPLPAGLEQKIQSAHTPELERWALRLIDAASIDEVFAS